MNAGPASVFSLVCLALAIALVGCRESEQGRRLDTGKGVYAGAEDQALDPETIDALSLRAEQQRF